MDSMRWPKQPPKPKKPPLTRLQIARRMLTFFFTPIIFGYCLMEVTVFIAEARRDGVRRDWAALLRRRADSGDAPPRVVAEAERWEKALQAKDEHEGAATGAGAAAERPHSGGDRA